MGRGGVTFVVAKTTLIKAELDKVNVADLVARNAVLGQHIMATSETPDLMRPEIDNGFVGAVLKAYNNHYRLCIRPDDVWVAITTAFAMYMNAGHAEALRNKFVSHQATEKLVVDAPGSVETA